ncbi:MAG: PH domain-containing protein [Propionibacteriaceae bacterium]|nr:PH domain-containing protein [Propionibacteriaceae bacterium]
MLSSEGGIAPGPPRAHPAYVLQSALRMIGLLFAGLVTTVAGVLSEAGDAREARQGIVVVGVVLVVAVTVVLAASYIHYKRFRWEITETDIHVYSGLFIKKQIHIPFTRVQSIDFTAGLANRLLGLVRLKVDTAGGAVNKGVVIPALKLGEAEALRAEVFIRKRRAAGPPAAAPAPPQPNRGALAGFAPPAQPFAPPSAGQPFWGLQPFGAPPSPPRPPTADDIVREVGDKVAGLRGIFADKYQEDSPVEHEYGLTAKELLLAAISGDRTLIVFALFLGGGFQTFQFASQFVPAAAEPVIVDFLRNLAASHIVFLAVAALLFFLFLGAVSTALSYGGFTARRRGGRVEVERGLLARQYKSVAIPRIQAVAIRQGLIRRLIGYAEIRLLTVDSMDSGNGQKNTRSFQSGLVVHPFAKAAEAEAVLGRLVPELKDSLAVVQLKPLPKVALRRSVIRFGVIPVLFYALCATAATVALTRSPVLSAQAAVITSTVWVLVSALLLLHLAGSVLWHRHAAYAYGSGRLVIRRGAYAQTTTIIPRRKIQWSATAQNPFQRRSKVANIAATTAAGIAATTFSLRDVAAEDAAAYLDWTRPAPRPADSPAV